MRARDDHAFALLLPVLVLGALAAGVILFGIVSLTTNFYVAAAYALFLVGLLLVLAPRGPPFLGLAFIVGGMLLYLASNSLPTLSVGEALSLGGAAP